MQENSEYAAALGVSVNVPISATTQVESKRVLDHCTTVLNGVATHFNGKVLDAAGGNLSIVFPAAQQALQAAETMSKRIQEMPPLAGEKITIGVGAASNLGKAMALMLGAGAGQIVTDSDFDALLQPDTIVPEGFAQLDVGMDTCVKSINHALETPEPEVVEVDAVEIEAEEPPPAAPGASGKSRLVLTYRDKTIVIDDQMREVKIGRGPECGLQTNDPWCSRVHATVLKQGGRFVLLDSSTNGTYYAIEDGMEAKLQKRPLTLGARGSFSLGRKAADALGGAIHYEQQ